jgi:hypothetical protein
MNKRFETEILEKSIIQKGNLLKSCFDDELFKSWSGDLQKRFPNAQWKTINGARVLVNGGKVVAGLDGFNGEIDKFFEEKGKKEKPVNERTQQEIFNAKQKIADTMPKPINKMTWKEFKPYGIEMAKQSSHSQPDSFYERVAKMEHDWAIKNDKSQYDVTDKQKESGTENKVEVSSNEKRAKEFRKDSTITQQMVVENMLKDKDYDKLTSDMGSAQEVRFYENLSKKLGMFDGNITLSDSYKNKPFGEFQEEIKSRLKEIAKDKRAAAWFRGLDPDEKVKDMAKYYPAEDKTITIDTFKDIAKLSKDPADFIKRTREVKNVPSEVAQEFFSKYGKGKSQEDAARAFMKEHGNKDEMDINLKKQVEENKSGKRKEIDLPF